MGIAYLKGTRVIACTWGWAGSWTGSILADMGAEVIKVESKRHKEHYSEHEKTRRGESIQGACQG